LKQHAQDVDVYKSMPQNYCTGIHDGQLRVTNSMTHIKKKKTKLNFANWYFQEEHDG